MRPVVRMPTLLCCRSWTSQAFAVLLPVIAEAEHAATTSTSLATTTITDGQVLPFSSLNCAALTNSVSGALAKEAGARRDFLYGRAMARVVAHEFYHVLMRTTEHGRSGCGPQLL